MSSEQRGTGISVKHTFGCSRGALRPGLGSVVSTGMPPSFPAQTDRAKNRQERGITYSCRAEIKMRSTAFLSSMLAFGTSIKHGN